MSDEASQRSPRVSETGADSATSRQAEEEAEPFQVKGAVPADMGQGLETIKSCINKSSKKEFLYNCRS